MISHLIKSIKIVTAGHHINRTRSIISTKITKRKIVKSTNIKTVLTKIPIPIEKTTNPFLYSFLSGLKNVLIIRGKDNI